LLWWVLLLCAGAPPAPLGGARDWIVVRVVVRERTEGAGEEKVLSAPQPPRPRDEESG